jgi:hypothetical protein
MALALLACQPGDVGIVSRIEDKLQGRYQSLPLGCPRLWRCRGKGAKYSEEEDQVHKVFITYSFKVQKAVKVGKLIIQE